MADELKNPVRRSVIGEIISIKEINKDDFKEGKFRHDCRIVRVDLLNGAPLVDVYITNDQYNKYGLNAIVFAGNVVNFSIDENIAGETGYIDPDTEEWTYHEKTFNSFAGADNVGSLGLICVFGKLGVGADIVSGFIKNIEIARKQREAVAKSKAVEAVTKSKAVEAVATEQAVEAVATEQAVEAVATEQAVEAVATEQAEEAA